MGANQPDRWNKPGRNQSTLRRPVNVLLSKPPLLVRRRPLRNVDGRGTHDRQLQQHSGAGAETGGETCAARASRLDTMQAAVLSEKLKIFPEEIDARNVVARRYADALADVATVLVLNQTTRSSRICL